MRGVKISKGKVALVDNEDFTLVSQFKWSAVKKGRSWYAMRWYQKSDGGYTTQEMHRLLLCPQKGLIVDHINGDGLDNRRKNLRTVSWVQNLWNRKKADNKSSRYLGVTRLKKRNRWVAVIRHDGRYEHIGLFKNEKDAARAWNEKAKLYRGDFAKLNKF